MYLREVLEAMKQRTSKNEGVKFNLKIWQFNKQNKSAGRVVEYRGCELMTPTQKTKYLRNPNHFENRTRNIKLPDGSVKTIHIIFIKEFNGKPVLY
ncbi:hypothetical protein MWN41_10775 [Ornithobacterium rhinotracheale]|uniref:hypothetical protein n=1 Tax=Ornithobacterium rhinotracheale TaxID=28251 RepID=UPI001FF48E4A|nr:hypothetical protein [Ornithobacterium rhinotracheale]MCK0203495.1 hypothetical protein [Ornithobacterium rhinotracheale]